LYTARDDGRLVLKLNRRPFDVIILRSSDPWTAGAALFTREFYELCVGQMNPDGILAQWIPLADMSDDLAGLILRTFNGTFPHFEIWDMNRGDVLLLGSRQPWATGADIFQAGFDRAGVREQLEAIGLRSPAAVWARQVASQRTAFAIPGPGPIQTDRSPILEYEAPPSRFGGNAPRLLSRYDERLAQSALAPIAKRKALAELLHQDALEVFSSYASWLDEVGRHIVTHAPDSSPTNLHASPCIFRPTEWEATPVPIDHTAPADRRHLAEAEGRIRTNADDWWRGVNDLLTVLRARPTPVGKEKPSFPVLEVARLAATAALQHAEAALATEILREAERLRVLHPDLDYLRRIADREAAPTSPGNP
jgi:hypothetical protein